MTVPIALVGIGKIARDQHLPAIEASGEFELVAAISRNATVGGVENYERLEDFLPRAPEGCAISFCTPPDVRTQMTIAALRAGQDVMIEKPPAATLGEVRAMHRAADEAGQVLYATWHSRRAAGVDAAVEWLSGRTIERIRIDWREDVRQWHPGQDWVFDPGGFGVFDPGINALSILTALVTDPVVVECAALEVPENRQTPIRADLDMRCNGVPCAMHLDWLAPGEPTWRIAVETDGGTLRLEEGGGRMFVDDAEQRLPEAEEYPRLYADFAGLIAERRSDVDARPLRIVADAMLRGEVQRGEPFHF